MNERFGNWFLFNGNCFIKNNFQLPQKFDFSIYEVIRIIDGIPLFLEDHLQRFIQSAKKLKIEELIDIENFIKEIKNIIEKNNCSIGNIKYALFKEENKIETFVYLIEHHYPEKELYQTGVKLVTCKAERALPDVKILNVDLKSKIDTILQDKNIYEVALVNNNNIITEGSKSNIFFIRGNILFTAKDDFVLKGVTRKKIFDITKLENIKVNFEPVICLALNTFESAFLCGTSPKILPISAIDNFSFNPENKLMKIIMDKYDAEIETYILSKKKFGK